jgi:hypothetical protein
LAERFLSPPATRTTHACVTLPSHPNASRRRADGGYLKYPVACGEIISIRVFTENSVTRMKRNLRLKPDYVLNCFHSGLFLNR